MTERVPADPVVELLNAQLAALAELRRKSSLCKREIENIERFVIGTAEALGYRVG